MAEIAKFLEMFSQQMETLVRAIAANSTTIPNFVPFEPTKELWNDYMSGVFHSMRLKSEY